MRSAASEGAGAASAVDRRVGPVCESASQREFCRRMAIDGHSLRWGGFPGSPKDRKLEMDIWLGSQMAICRVTGVPRRAAAARI